MNHQVKVFIDMLIEEKKFQNLSPELREDIFNDLYAKLNLYIVTALTKYLEEADVKRLEAMERTDDYSPEKIQKLLADRIPNASEIIAQAMLEFRAIYLNS